MARRTIVVDCDPGFDDAIALLLALAAPDEIELAGVTTVAGNVPLGHTHRNALAILDAAGSSVPVHAGIDRPLLVPLHTSAYVHGEDGLLGLDLAPPSQTIPRCHAVDAIIRLVRDRPAKSVTICAIGPLTNVAVALRLAPDLADRVERIVIMGGAVGLGNVTPAAEFNFYVDPHAAAIVLDAGMPTVLVPLDVTERIRVERPLADRLIGASEAIPGVAGRLLLAASDVRTRRGSVAIHDACVIAWLLDPSAFAGRDCSVTILPDPGPGRGRSIVDWHGVTDAPRPVQVLREVDAERVGRLLGERLLAATSALEG